MSVATFSQRSVLQSGRAWELAGGVVVEEVDEFAVGFVVDVEFPAELAGEFWAGEFWDGGGAALAATAHILRPIRSMEDSLLMSFRMSALEGWLPCCGSLRAIRGDRCREISGRTLKYHCLHTVVVAEPRGGFRSAGQSIPDTGSAFWAGLSAFGGIRWASTRKNYISYVSRSAETDAKIRNR